ncbi:MAG: IS1182 family transposase [Butyrivibrio sp.]|nr:IS1182 family transposase [Butyrivibrio sp.]
MIAKAEIPLSPYMDLYDIVVPQDHELRKIKSLVDFSFVEDMLRDAYTTDNGRPAYPPVMMFKYLLLKRIYELSDRDLVKRALSDMAFKYFLDLSPEENVIDDTTLTKFRKLRLKDESVMDELVKQSVKIALENGLNLSGTLIVDSTHTKARYGPKSAREYLLELCKNLRKKVYSIDGSYHDKMPSKPDHKQIGQYEDVIDYCKKVISVVKDDDKLSAYINIKENINLLEEVIDDVNEQLILSKDEDARIGHKSADSAFFGYKSHIAMTPERIITAVTVTSGEKDDGKQLESLVDKMNDNGVKVENIVGDGAYSEPNNITYANDHNIKLSAKLSNTVLNGNKKKPLDDQFTYNKDAKMYVCPEGHMAIRKYVSGKNDPDKPLRESYFFDIEKCKVCPLRDKCGYKEGSRSKSYNVTVKMSKLHEDHQANQESDEYKTLARERYKIEVKNAELKNNYGYDECAYAGLHGMTLQAGVSVFVVNIKRILKLLEEKNDNKEEK